MVRKTASWILAVFVLSRIINFDWGFPGIILFDSLSALILGVLISSLQIQLQKSKKKYLNILIVSALFAFLLEPLILHYEVTMSLLRKTSGTHPTVPSIYLEGLMRSVPKLLIAACLFFLLISAALYLLENSSRIEKNKGNR